MVVKTVLSILYALSETFIARRIATYFDSHYRHNFIARYFLSEPVVTTIPKFFPKLKYDETIKLSGDSFQKK